MSATILVGSISFGGSLVSSTVGPVFINNLSLRQQRCLFTVQLGRLIHQAVMMGFEINLEDGGKRPQAQANANAASGKGIRNSLHTIGLAADINLYKDGIYLPNTEAHQKLGEWWEEQHPLNRWGGRFGDGNHYSSTRDGVK